MTSVRGGEWVGEGWGGWTHKLGLRLRREREVETRVCSATRDRQIGLSIFYNFSSWLNRTQPNSQEAGRIPSSVRIWGGAQLTPPPCVAQTSRQCQDMGKMLWRVTLAVAVVCVGCICNCVQADLMSRLIIPRDYGVKLCGREFIRAVIFTCGGSRWRRSTEGSLTLGELTLLHFK